MPATDLIALLVLGLMAGAFGGMLGIGGSIIAIPVLTLVMSRDHHVSQAAAMIMNVCVAVPAVLRHHRAGSVDWPIVRRALPAGILFILIGVALSNVLPAWVLMRLFGVFLLYVLYAKLRKYFAGGPPPEVGAVHRGWFAASSVGAITGFAAGLLGIGGGVLTVPMLQHLCHIPLRRSIGASAALMCLTASTGALSKNLALSSIVNGGAAPLDPMESLKIAGCLAPTAIIGGMIGAHLTHILPLKWVRVTLFVLLCFAAVKFLGL